MAILELEQVSKYYRGESRPAVADFNLRTENGEFIVLVGPSGCGKTTTMRMVAGLEEITKGDIRIGGNSVASVPPGERDIAMVFQNYALYPHMTVRENMSFSLQIKKIKKNEIAARLQRVAQMLGLTDLLDRKPRALSGGQQQRVALGRAIIREPQVFLMDEPLSNLDAQLRSEMRREIVKLQRALNVTTLYVTHDQIEAMTMGHRIVVMKDGLVQQIGTASELYEMPANIFVAGFIGMPTMNLLRLDDIDGEDKEMWAKSVRGLTEVGESKIDNVIIGIRPEGLRAMGDGEKDLFLRGSIEVVEPLGDRMILQVKSGSVSVAAQADGRERWVIGDNIDLTCSRDSLYLFERRTGRALPRRSNCS